MIQLYFLLRPLSSQEARIAAQSRGDPLAKPAAHRGRLVTVAPQDPYAWARMTPAQQKNAERHAQVRQGVPTSKHADLLPA